MLSLAYLTVDGAGPVEHVEAAAAGGFDAAGLRIEAPSHITGARNVVGDAALLREVKHALAATGMRVLDAEIATLAPDSNVARYRAILDTAAELGAAYVQAVCEDPDLSRATDRFAALCDAAAEMGLKVALEFMQFRTVRSAADALAMVERAGRPNGLILVDALHLSRSGGSPASVAALPPERIAFMQLCDAPLAQPSPDGLIREARTARLHPGQGELWLHRLLDALPPGIAISVEVPNRADAGLTALERAERAGEAARRFLAGRR